MCVKYTFPLWFITGAAAASHSRRYWTGPDRTGPGLLSGFTPEPDPESSALALHCASRANVCLARARAPGRTAVCALPCFLFLLHHHHRRRRLRLQRPRSFDNLHLSYFSLLTSEKHFDEAPRSDDTVTHFTPAEFSSVKV